MKYVEELLAGNCFIYNNNYYLITVNFKSNNQRLCYNLDSGFPHWISGETIVDDIQIYTMDEKNTIIPIKENKKEHKNVSS
jgi:hypothetical protein